MVSTHNRGIDNGELILVEGLFQQGTPWTDGTPGVTQVSSRSWASRMCLSELRYRLPYLQGAVLPTVSRFKTSMAFIGTILNRKPTTAMGFLDRSVSIQALLVTNRSLLFPQVTLHWLR